MEKNRRQSFSYPLLVLSLILLTNISIGIIDILPDAIAYFLLARIFLTASDRAPFFQEAREAFIKLAWINVAKLPGLFILALSRMQGSFGNDTSVLLSLVFAVCECIVLIPAVKNIFAALFRLGERTEASALITPFGKAHTDPEALMRLTYVFAVAKCVFAALPDMFLLTRASDDGFSLSTISIGYPISLVLVQIFGTALGVCWLIVAIKYAKAVHKEGQFSSALEMIAGYDPENKLVAKKKIRNIGFALTLFTVAAFFSFDIKFDNTGGINLLPNFIYGAVLLLALFKLRDYLPRRNMVYLYASGAAYCVYALISYIFEVYFLYYYGYDDLVKSAEALEFYLFVEIVAVYELIVLTIFTVLIALALKSFVYRHTGISPSHKRYSRADKDYHAALVRGVFWLCAVMILSGAAKCINTISRGSVEMVFTQTAIISYLPALEWMGLVCTACSTVLCGLSLYLFTSLKEEVAMKYNKI